MPIRIVAPLPLLIALAVVGSLLGSIIGTRLPRMPSRSTSRFNAIAAGAGLALIAEIIAVLTLRGGSKFILFGFDLDPQQLLTTPALGLLVGLYRFRSGDKFGTILGIKLPKG